MKTKEELRALKTEVAQLYKKLSELTVEELEEVTGGYPSPKLPEDNIGVFPSPKLPEPGIGGPDGPTAGGGNIGTDRSFR